VILPAIFTAPPSRVECTVRFTVGMARSMNSRRLPNPAEPGQKPFSIASRAQLTARGRAALVRDPRGNLYGTTITPTVFELSPPAVAGGSWTETTLNNFPVAKDGGGEVYAGLTFRLLGKITLDGATTSGGIENNGVIFSLTP
jgi:hypothetical protein